ncbi:DoxX family protein [Mycobacterium sp. PS03-16]|uniref:DoxX family protein n=1 Tax=Mycobacterium sp. PS03-16 TaxID=2559611 RepID=UPI0010748E66|nr:DoxX family protein [Mycobacterium sp. PS03-16]TFV55572.1 DoxX family protein [Mycobacterium sp. PS03-16]
MTNTEVLTVDSARAGTGTDIALLILRIGVGATMLQAGLIKAFDFGTTVEFMRADWRLPELAAFMVTATETLGGLGLLLGLLTPLAATAVIAAMLDAWAVNVSAGAFWSQPFNVPFLVAVGAAALLFAGAGGYAVDARLGARVRPGVRVAVALLVVAVVAAVLTWVALNGSNPIHFSAPTG